MKQTSNQDERIANMVFWSIYPHYVTKIEKKGRTIDELYQVITWLTWYDKNKLSELTKTEINFKDFFEWAELNQNANLITWVICGCRVEDIINPLTQQVRYLDKLVDELAKGKDLEKILRK